MPPTLPPTSRGQDPTAPQDYEIHIFAGYTIVDPAPPGSWQLVDMDWHAVSDTVDGTLRVPAGHEISVTYRLRDQGAHIVVHDHRVVPIRLVPDSEACDSIGASDAGYVNAVVSNFRGAIESPTLSRTLERIAVLCGAFPTARILIPVPNRSTADLVRTGLIESLGTRLRGPLTTGGIPDGICWVTSFAQMAKQDPGNWDLVLIPELARSTRKVAESAFLRFAEFSGKLFGFAHHDDCIRTSFPSIAGSVVYRETRPRVGVQMAWLAPRSVKIRQESATRKFKESAYYINRNRNEYIAAVARNFAKGDVWRDGVPLSQDRPAVRGGQSPAIVILVETREHGQELQRFIPEAELSTLDDDAEEGGRRLYIVTVAATLNYWIQADIVIVASGELALLTTPDFPPLRLRPDDADVLVIDFLDSGNLRMSQAGLDRYRDGYSKGWRDAPWSTPGHSQY